MQPSWHALFVDEASVTRARCTALHSTAAQRGAQLSAALPTHLRSCQRRSSPSGFAAFSVLPQDCVGYEDAPLGMQAIKAAGFLKAGFAVLLVQPCA